MKTTYRQQKAYDRLMKMADSLGLTDSLAIYNALEYAETNRHDPLCWSLLFTATDNVVMEDKERSRARKARFIILKYSNDTSERYCRWANETARMELWCHNCQDDGYDK